MPGVADADDPRLVLAADKDLLGDHLKRYLALTVADGVATHVLQV